MYSLHYYKKAVLPVQLLELSLSVCTSSEQIIQLFRQHLAFVHYILSTEVPVPTTCTLPMMQADRPIFHVHVQKKSVLQCRSLREIDGLMQKSTVLCLQSYNA